MSRLAGASCKSILYCRPEQPPPTTATRSTPLGRPCLVSKVLTLVAAPAVSLIRRSSPVRKPGLAVGLAVVLAITGVTLTSGGRESMRGWEGQNARASQAELAEPVLYLFEMEIQRAQ